MTVNGPDAPWNEERLPEEEIEVTISVSLSKTVKILVDDYNVEEDVDEAGKCLSYDFSKCNLYRAVEKQVVLPQNLAEFIERVFECNFNLKISKMPRYLKDAVADCKDWSVDEIEVIPQ